MRSVAGVMFSYSYTFYKENIQTLRMSYLSVSLQGKKPAAPGITEMIDDNCYKLSSSSFRFSLSKFSLNNSFA